MAAAVPTPLPKTMQGYAPPEWDQILVASMKNDSLGIRRLITEGGVNPNHANAVAQSALHIASLWGNVEAVQELLRHKAEPNAQNNLTGATPLHCAVQSMKGEKVRRLQCMELLIENGADVSRMDYFRKVPAEYAEGDTDIVQKLQPQTPPLFQAIHEGNLEEVKQLLAAKSDDDAATPPPYEQIFMGDSPFQRTLNLLLAEEEEETNTTFDRSKLVEILKSLLEAGANVNEHDGNNDSNPIQALENPILPPLYRVCEALEQAYKNKQDTALLEETCQILLHHKATVTPELQQMLHSACRKNELQFAKLLIEVLQIDPNIKGRQGMTPLQFAARSGKTEMVRYLLSLPTIDIDIPDDRGQTALDAAKVNNKEEVVTLLEEFAKK